MSCWRKYECKVLTNVHKDLLEETCAELGFTLDYSIKEVRNAYGYTNVDCALVDKTGEILSLGFVFNKSEGKTNITVSGDFWGTGLDESVFVDQLSQIYQKHNVINALQASYYNVSSVTTNADGAIEIEACMYA